MNRSNSGYLSTSVKRSGGSMRRVSVNNAAETSTPSSQRNKYSMKTVSEASPYLKSTGSTKKLQKDVPLKKAPRSKSGQLEPHSKEVQEPRRAKSEEFGSYASTDRSITNTPVRTRPSIRRSGSRRATSARSKSPTSFRKGRRKPENERMYASFSNFSTPSPRLHKPREEERLQSSYGSSQGLNSSSSSFDVGQESNLHGSFATFDSNDRMSSPLRALRTSSKDTRARNTSCEIRPPETPKNITGREKARLYLQHGILIATDATPNTPSATPRQVHQPYGTPVTPDVMPRSILSISPHGSEPNTPGNQRPDATPRRMSSISPRSSDTNTPDSKRASRRLSYGESEPNMQNVQQTPRRRSRGDYANELQTPDSERPRRTTSKDGTRKGGRPRPPLSCSSSSSSLEGHTRTVRKNRRRKPKASQESESPPTPRQEKKKKPGRRPKSKDYLNHSFNDSFGSSDDHENPRLRSMSSDSVEEEPTPDGRKEVLSEAPSFLIPKSPEKQSKSATESTSQYDTAPSSAVMDSKQTKLYEYAKACQWDLVDRECREKPWTSKYVGEEDGTTALHLAVMSRANPMLRDGALGEFQPAPLSLVELLIVACPEAAIIRCTTKRYTPLCYACLVADKGFDMDDAADMVRIILKHAPHSALVFTDDGFSALDVHIISYSRLHQEKKEVYSSTGRTSTVVLRTLLAENPSLAEARSYGSRIRGPVELLYRCNLQEFKEASGEEIASKHKSRSGKRETHTVASTLSDWWAWKWALILLKTCARPKDEGNEEAAPFSAVHAAAQLTGCPISVLSLAIDAFPLQVRNRSPRNGLYNCPLHEVCSWVTDDLHLTGDPFVSKRKAKAIELLLEAFPKAARMTNDMGETPLQLAIETCTPWAKGLEALVVTFPKALTVPRSVENCPDDSPLSKAVLLHEEDVGSVGSNEEEWVDNALEAVEGMYPFMVAAVLSHVSERRYHAPFMFSEKSTKDHEKELKDKDRESLRSIYGLLRAEPDAIALFFEDEKIRRMLENESTEESDDEDSEDSCTEPYIEEEAETQYTEEEVETLYTEEEITVDSPSQYSEEEVVSTCTSQYTEVEVQSRSNYSG